MKFKFKKDTTTNRKVYGAMLVNGNEGTFICWFDMEKLDKGETRNEFMDRVIKGAGYDSREDFWESAKLNGRICTKGKI